MKIIIAGSRLYTDKDFLFLECFEIIAKLQYEHEIPLSDIEIFSGHNPNGADYYGEKFAEKYKIKLRLFPADWNDVTTPPVFIKYNSFGSYNAMAGNVRNEKMAQCATQNDVGVLIAFAVNASPETKNMVSIAKRYGMKIFLYEFTNKSGILTRKVSKKKVSK